MTAPIIGYNDVQPMLLQPNWARANPDHHQLVVDLGNKVLADDDRARLSTWVLAQAIPVVGINVAADDHKVFDVIATDSDVTQLCNCISANPRASSVLVQVTRTTPWLALSQALHVESLAYATLQSGEEFAQWLNLQPPRSTYEPTVSPVEVARDNNTLRIVLNCPTNRNALSAPMRDALSDAFQLAAVDTSIKHVEVRGAGPVFSAGGDLSEFGTQTDQSQAHYIRTLAMPAQYLAQIAVKTTFQLHGACIGAGIELPAFAGHLVATADTLFRLPEIAMGLIPGAGGCVSLPRRIGRQNTNRLALLGENIDAEAARQMGLIDQISN